MPNDHPNQHNIGAGGGPQAEDFRQALLGFLYEAEKDGRAHVEVSAAQLHRALGGYPGEKHRLPICCSVMRTSMRPGDSILCAPPSGTGPDLTVRFVLPRSSAPAAGR
jgi:hypothetical protein